MVAINLQNYTMIQLVALKGKFKRHYERLKQNFDQMFIRNFIQQAPDTGSYKEQQNFINLIPMGKPMIYQLDQ